VRLEIDADIRRAESLPGAAYCDPSLHQAILDRVFVPSWQLAPEPTHPVVPFVLLPGALDEPLLMVRRGDQLHCLSNVCTHRGAVLCERACDPQTLRCRYHGRSFALDGRMIVLRSRPSSPPAVDVDREESAIIYLISAALCSAAFSTPAAVQSGAESIDRSF